MGTRAPHYVSPTPSGPREPGLDSRPTRVGEKSPVLLEGAGGGVAAMANHPLHRDVRKGSACEGERPAVASEQLSERIREVASVNIELL
jgi:hypothetical protein